MEYLIPFLNSIVPNLPLYIVWLLALSISFERWERHPQVSKLTAVAAITFIGLQLLGSAIIFIPIYVFPDWTSTQIGLFVAISGFLLSILSAIAWGLIIKAIFGWRKSEL